jgi:hypothetical protein
MFILALSWTKKITQNLFTNWYNAYFKSAKTHGNLHLHLLWYFSQNSSLYRFLTINTLCVTLDFILTNNLLPLHGTHETGLSWSLVNKCQYTFTWRYATEHTATTWPEMSHTWTNKLATSVGTTLNGICYRSTPASTEIISVKSHNDKQTKLCDRLYVYHKFATKRNSDPVRDD